MSGMEKPGLFLREGKTKTIWHDVMTGGLLIESKDAITAGDGARRDIIEGKGALATQTTANCFELLTRAGVPNHYLGRVEGNERMFRAQHLDMIPIELVTRRVAWKSFLDRNPDVSERTRFDDVVFEMFGKNDKQHDPLLVYDFQKGIVGKHHAHKPISDESLIENRQAIYLSEFPLSESEAATLARLATATFTLLEAAWAAQDVMLVDLKIECGKTAAGEIMVGDVIDNDSWRIWRHGNPDEMADKQLYRDGKPLEYVADQYAWVAEATNAFAA
jgi:phosphoribosylaminoimidazole-succinocarboxamide synthase